MSTFDGIVEEFPYIQIDYFRKKPDRPPPLACFLSHVHSDHLQGLESFRAPFIYCSPATRELLLRIEKYPHRMNFNKGILESRRLHYKHLYKLLRPIPLNTPTEIELTPRHSIRVTLLDANHCAGAVMFLIEGDGKAVLYTGDIRAESWWVNSLIRHPVLIPYTMGGKVLERLYLDTTFARASNIYREFPSKAEGLAEVLRKIDLYPNDTVFYFRAWTFGYEDVWLALSAVLNSNVHVDRYQMGLYKSLSERARGAIGEGPGLCGFELGNGFVPGCLSNDEKCRIHSCEPGTPCAAMKSESDKTVYVCPIINRMMDGVEVLEEGAGGGGGDLYQLHELELPDLSEMEELQKLCFETVHDRQALSRIKQALARAWRSKNRTLSLDSYGKKDDSDIPLETLVSILGREQPGSRSNGKSAAEQSRPNQALPNTIHFPYSRHSSYTELRNLVSAFKPKDIYPCTADALDWTEDMSVETLFGDLCSDSRFIHDAYMRDIQDANDIRPKKRVRHDGEFSPQSTQQSGLVDEDRAAASLTDSCPSVQEPYAPAGLTVSSQERLSLQTTPELLRADNRNKSSSPLQIPKLTPTTEHTKLSNIRQAWRYLRTDPEGTGSAFQVGSLPSSFPTEEASIKPANQQQRLSPPHQNLTNTTISQTIQSTTTGPSPAPASHQYDGGKETQGGNTQTPSLESQSQRTEDHHPITTANNEPQPPDPLSSAPSLPQNPHHPPPLVRSGSSSRLRREAYLAAKADSYDAWSSVGLLSTGNNHTEEEIEL